MQTVIGLLLVAGMCLAALLSSRGPEDKLERSLSVWTAVLGIATICLVAATMYNAIVLQHTDEKIREQLEALKLEQRAWVDLTFDEVDVSIDNGIAAISLRFLAKNTGKLPAMSVYPWATLIALPSLEREDAPKHAPPACLTRDPAFLRTGSAVFPQQTGQYREFLSTDFSKTITGERFALYLTGCVVYRSALDTQVHQTPFEAYLLPRNGPVLFQKKDAKNIAVSVTSLNTTRNPD